MPDCEAQEKRSEILTQGPAQTWETQTTRNPTEAGTSQQEQDLKKKIRKGIDKLKFYLEEGNKLLKVR